MFCFVWVTVLGHRFLRQPSHLPFPSPRLLHVSLLDALAHPPALISLGTRSPVTADTRGDGVEGVGAWGRLEAR
jgi:hypothetical protein